MKSKRRLHKAYFTFIPRHFIKSQGFTIIELLVVISIIVILSSVGLASFVSYSRTQVLEQAANDLKVAIERAKFNSISKVKPKECTSDESVSGYTVNFCSNCADYSYQVVANCGNDTVPMATKKFQKNLSFSSISCSAVTFYVLSNTIGCTDPNGILPAAVDLSAYGHTKTVVVDSAGNVSIQ